MEDELISINAIYGSNTLVTSNDSKLLAILTLPCLPDISFKIGFPDAYPESCPYMLGPHSSGQQTQKGEAQALALTIEVLLQEAFVPGEPCIFALIELCNERIIPAEQQDPDARSTASEEIIQGSTAALRASQYAGPSWSVSEVITEKKSVFVARAAVVHSPAEAQENLAHLLITDKKVARATHNITAWRIKGDNGVQYQDCDDDGETAAGGRLLHLLELMDAWDVMVVVTRWYGGVHLGPDRFRLINQAARDALVNAGFAEGSRKKGKK